MDDADLRGLDERLADDLDQVGGQLDGDRAARGDDVRERLSALEELRGEVRLVAGRAGPLAGHHDLGHAGAAHALELLELAVEPLGDAGQREDRRGHDLDGYRLVSILLVDRLVHRTGASAAEVGAELEPDG